MNCLTLPIIAANNGLNLDLLRRLVKRTPDLDRIGIRVGATRSYTAAEAEVIVAAMLNRYPRKK